MKTNSVMNCQNNVVMKIMKIYGKIIIKQYVSN
jgi:hypothetical protein